jgi:hypothetical protein
MLALMNETETPKYISAGKSQFGNLLDFVVSKDGEHFNLEVAVMTDGRVVVFRSHPFKNDVSWFEFDLTTNKLDFVLDDGESRDIGLPLTKDVAKYMQNAHQILMVLMDPETGEPRDGTYIPLVIHRS